MASDAGVFDEADLNAFTDGRLEPVRAAALAESLAADRVARARIDGWKRQNDSLRTLFASVLFEPVPVRLLPTTLAAGATPPVPVPRAQAGAAVRGSSAAVLTVTALGVALVGFMAGALATLATDGFGRSAWNLRTAVSDPALEADGIGRRAAEAYQAALADPDRGESPAAWDPARLQHWMTRQFSAAARIPDLRPQGWALLGGHVVPGRRGPAAFLLYGRGSERLGLSVARESASAGAGVPAVGGLTVTTWDGDAFSVALVSAGGGGFASTATDPVGDAIRRQMTSEPPAP